MTIDIDRIMELINIQMKTIIDSDEIYSKYSVIVSGEQQFAKAKTESGKIYMVVKFLPASINFGQYVVPITINAISERNKLDICQKLLTDYAETYNLVSADNETMKQGYTSPSVLSNFNEVFEGFRSVLYMSGTILISKESNPFKVYYNGEEVPCITCGDSFDVQLDSQAFLNGEDFTKSESKIASYTINFTTYVLDNDLNNNVIKQKFKKLPINHSYQFTVKYKNGLEATLEFKIVNATGQQNLGEIPIVSMTFAS